MGKLLSRRKFSRMVLGVVAAGALTVTAASGQATTTAKKPAQKNSTSKGGTHSTNASSPSAKTSAHKTTHSSNAAAHPTTHSTKATEASAKSTRTAGTRSRRQKTKKAKGQMTPTPERIVEIQEALAKKGALTASPTGAWDDSTISAMKQFQTSNGLNPTGKLDALTLQRLGLGSQTAGLAAPIAPPNVVNRLRNYSSEPSN
jgi:cytoskeletal protein RodZ